MKIMKITTKLLLKYPYLFSILLFIIIINLFKRTEYLFFNNSNNDRNIKAVCSQMI